MSTTSAPERFRDGGGSASLGWLSGRVLYARFDGRISALLADHVVNRFGEIARLGAGSYYFLDARGVNDWQPLAFADVADALLTHRRRFKLSVARFSNLSSPVLQPPRDVIGIELASSDENFATRLRAAAGPHCPLDWRTVATGRRDDVGEASTHSRSPAYVYVFDLRNFEQGRFTAHRSEALSTRPRGSWACVSRDDDRALRLARSAATNEWPRPFTRDVLTFTVRFVDTAPIQPRSRDPIQHEEA